MMHPVGALEKFAEGSITIVEIEDRSVGIVNAGGEIYAVLNVCPHALAPICEGRLTGTFVPSKPGTAVWGMQNRILRCPWHGFEFDLANQGQTVFTTFKARVRMFPVTVANGRVSVDVPERRSAPQVAEPTAS
jgi:nitrite reductase/ring-hydroxylating ferredoxin subunit